MKPIGPFLGVALLALTACSKPRTPEISGYWKGQLNVNGATLNLGLDVRKDAAEMYTATLDSVDQGARDIPIGEIKYDAQGSLHLSLPALAATYDGKAAPRGKIEGTWKQGPFTAPLVWARGTKPAAVDPTESDKAFASRPGSVIQGIWKGTLVIGPTQLRILFKIAESSDGKFSGMLDSLDQGARNIPMTSVSFTKPTLDLEVKQIGGTFDGKLTPDGNEIVGEWEQLGRTTPLTLTKAEPAELAAKADESGYRRASDAEPQGIWTGALSVRGTKLRLVMKVARDAKGQLNGTMDSPDQGARDLPMSHVTFTNGTMRMDWQGINASFEGDLADGKLDGEWRQMGASLPLVLQRTNAPEVATKP
jgi:hypothetical protein